MKLGASRTARPISAHRMLLNSNSASAFLALSFVEGLTGFMVQRWGMSLTEKPRLTVASAGMGGMLASQSSQAWRMAAKR